MKIPVFPALTQTGPTSLPDAWKNEKTNPVLGYRTAGSAAETATGDMLYREMKAIGLTDVTRDTFSLDGWEFEKAVLKFTDDSGQEHTFTDGRISDKFRDRRI